MKFYALAPILAMTFAAYSGSIYSPWQFDDDHFIQKNPSVTFHAPIHLSVPRPLTLTTYRVNYLFGGENTAGYHAVNLAIHGINVLLVFIFLVPLLGEFAAFLACGIFALHPLQSEAVIYLSARTELLMTMFVLLALILTARLKPHANHKFLSREIWSPVGQFQTGDDFLVVGSVGQANQSPRMQKCRRFVHVVIIALCCLLAILSKESGIVSIPLVFAYAYWQRIYLPRWVYGLALGFCSFAGVYLYRTAHFVESGRSWLEHALLQNGQLWQYLAMVIAPVRLSIDHDPDISAGLVALAALATMAVLGGVISVYIRQPSPDIRLTPVPPYKSSQSDFSRLPAMPHSLRRHAGPSIAFIAIALFPRFVINIPERLAEHHMMLPFVAISALAALSINYLIDFALGETINGIHRRPQVSETALESVGSTD